MVSNATSSRTLRFNFGISPNHPVASLVVVDLIGLFFGYPLFPVFDPF